MSFEERFTREEREAFEALSADRIRMPELLSPTITIGGRDYTRHLLEWGYGREDGIAVLLIATLSVALPESLELSEARLYFTSARYPDVALPAYRGRVAALRVEGNETLITAATAGYFAERTPVGRSPADDYELVSAEPSAVLYEGLQRLPYRGYEIPPVAGPRVDRMADEAFSWTDSVKDIIEAAEGDEVLRAVDTPLDVASAYTPGPITGEAVWEFEEGRDTAAGGIVDDTPDGERYAAVQVYRADPTEDTALTVPVEIDPRGRNVPPTSVYLMEYTAEDAAAGENAYQMAFNEAERRSRLRAAVKITPTYPCFFLHRGDVVIARRREIDEHEIRTYTYRARLDAVAVEETGSELSGEGELVDVQTRVLERAAFAALAGRLAERPGGFTRPLWGFDVDGAPYFDDALPWASDDGEFVALDVAVAASYGVAITEEAEIVQVMD